MYEIRENAKYEESWADFDKTNVKLLVRWGAEGGEARESMGDALLRVIEEIRSIFEEFIRSEEL